IDMPFTKRLHITALRSESKSINRIFQRTAVRTLDLSSCREDNLSGLHFFPFLNGAVCLHNTAQAHMGTAADNRIMIHYSSAVDKRSSFNMSMCIYNCPLHDKAARLDHSTGADDCRWVHDGRHFIAFLYQFVCPVQTCTVIAESRYRGSVFL